MGIRKNNKTKVQSSYNRHAYEVGDLVLIHPDLKYLPDAIRGPSSIDCYISNRFMKENSGMLAIIKSLDGRGTYTLDIDDECYYWPHEWLFKVDNYND